MKKLLLPITLSISLFAQTISIDKNNPEVHLKNNTVNLLKFPFVISEATATTENPDDFTISSKNQTVTIVPSSANDKEKADLLVWSSSGDAYLLKLSVDGKTEQIFDMSSQKAEPVKTIKASRFETGQVESDIKSLIKSMVSTDSVEGYKKIEVKKMFKTHDLEMQKEFFYDGGKYRVEEWFLKNSTNDTLYLSYDNFFTTGILGISFEKQTIAPGEISKAWFVVDKNTVYQEMKEK